MAYSATRKAFGVCGNVRFKFYDITDVQTSKNVVKPYMNVKFAVATNTTDNTEVMMAKPLNWTGTADTDTANKLVDTSETFVQELNRSHVFATSGTNEGAPAIIEFLSADTDALSLFSCASEAATDLFPSGNETYALLDDHKVELDVGTNDDDGTLLIMGE